MAAGGVGISVVVLVMVLAAITLLPALLGLAGHHISPPPPLRPAYDGRPDRRGAGPAGARTSPGTRTAYLVGGTALLLALAAPVLALRLGMPDEGSYPRPAPSGAPTT